MTSSLEEAAVVVGVASSVSIATVLDANSKPSMATCSSVPIRTCTCTSSSSLASVSFRNTTPRGSVDTPSVERGMMVSVVWPAISCSGPSPKFTRA